MPEPENLFLFDLNAAAVCDSIAERWITCRRRSPYGKEGRGRPERSAVLKAADDFSLWGVTPWLAPRD